MKKARTTIKDIAKLANVTPQAVSRALRDAPDISVATKARILEIATQLNYCKNTTASALRSGYSHSVAVVYDELKNVYYSIMIDFLQSCLEARGFSVLTLSYRYSYLTKETYLNAISHNVDGVISFLDPKEEIEDLINNYHVPVLLFGRYTDIKNMDCVYMDDKRGGRLAAERFLQKGCKKPLVVTLPDELICVQERIEGFAECWKEHGVTHMQVCRKNERFQKEFLAHFESAENAPDCIFCFNDMLAFEVLAMLSANGLPIPPVIGYDDIQEQIPLPHRLTTIGMDKYLMAEKGVQMLLDRVLGHTAQGFKKEKMPVRLVTGESA